MTISEEKKRLRQEVRAAERAFPASDRPASNQAILSRLLSLPAYRAAGTVFCFVATSREIDTRALLEDALQTGKRLCVPRCVGPGHMELRLIRALSELSPGVMGILEPSGDAPMIAAAQVDFAVVPCVTCDRFGHRLGQGGGYYDRFLADYHGSAALPCREALLRERIPLESHDRRIPLVVTEAGIWENGAPAAESFP